MITDQLDRCPFCQSMMRLDKSYAIWCLECPCEFDHAGKYLFACFKDRYSDELQTVDIRLNQYLLVWKLGHNETDLFVWSQYRNTHTRKKVLTLPFLLDIQLDEQIIIDKIRTLITFS